MSKYSFRVFRSTPFRFPRTDVSGSPQPETKRANITFISSFHPILKDRCQIYRVPPNLKTDLTFSSSLLLFFHGQMSDISGSPQPKTKRANHTFSYSLLLFLQGQMSDISGSSQPEPTKANPNLFPPSHQSLPSNSRRQMCRVPLSNLT